MWKQGIRNLEVSRQVLELIIRYGDTFDIRVFLPFKTDKRFIKHYALLFLIEHPNEAFHEILTG